MKYLVTPFLYVLIFPKLFAPGHNGPSKFSRMGNLAAIIDHNAQAAQRSAAAQIDPDQILHHYRRILRMLEESGGEETTMECTHQ